DLDQTIDKFFPEIVQAESITIRHLLSHRSGIHNFTNDESYLTWNTQPKTEGEMREIIAKAGIDFEPGSKASYSNSNFVLLTYILEKSFGKSYLELLTTYIVDPLRLEDTYLGGKINVQKNECRSYSYLETWQRAPETDMSIPLGAGAIVSTPVDMVKFSDALFGGRLVKQESLDQMMEMNDNYGLGLMPIPFYDIKGYGHGGGIDGFSSILCHFNENNVSYAMTINGANFNINNISIAVLSAVYNRAFDIPSFNTFEVDTADLEKYVGMYSSAQLPLKITVTRVNKTLIAQATGQSAFPLEATGKDVFAFEQAGVVMEFSPQENKMVLKQGGGKFDFKKD
ncbi:MAG: beta-lactamase family protein, partial [Bacteroidales bacterium]|nr:beta-lactamase family protein [Bacteroidales bacterium]